MKHSFFLFAPLFAVAFVALWLFVCFVIAQTGWKRLRDFATHSAPVGETYFLESATIGGARYRGALVIVVAPNGLYLRPLWLFSFAHRPLFIPYGAFGAYRSQKVLWMQTTEYTIHNSYGQKVPLALENQKLAAVVSAKVEAQRALQGGSLRHSARSFDNSPLG